MEEVGHRMPGAVPGQGSHLRAKAFLGFHIEPTIVSGLQEAPSALAWVPPRVSRCSDVLLRLLGWLGLCRGMPVALWIWLCHWNLPAGWSSVWFAEQDAVVRSGLQQCPQVSDLLRVTSRSHMSGDPCGRALGVHPQDQVHA